MSPVRMWLLCCALAGLVGCASLQIAQPQTWNQRVAYVNGTLTALYDSIRSCVTSMACSKETGRELIVQVDTARTAVDIAGAAPSGDTIAVCWGEPQPALRCLMAAQSVLDGVAAYLRAKEAK